MPEGSGFPTQKQIRAVPAEMAQRLIVALDVPTIEEARSLVRELEGTVSFFKVGLWLLFAEGAESFIDELIRSKKDVFLDYKMYDIGETVKQGVARAVERGVRFVTVHGDAEIMKAAVQGKGDSDFLKIFSITVLTSLDEQDLRAMGYLVAVPDLIEMRVRQSVESGCDGIIASAEDRPDEIRRLARADQLLIATPGIRQRGAAIGDHKRFATPDQAIADGADYLIVGRPIVRPQHGTSVEAARRIIVEMKKGQALRNSRV